MWTDGTWLREEQHDDMAEDQSPVSFAPLGAPNGNHSRQRPSHIADKLWSKPTSPNEAVEILAGRPVGWDIVVGEKDRTRKQVKPLWTKPGIERSPWDGGVECKKLEVSDDMVQR